MSDCTYCGGSGYSSIGAMCRCPLGVALRLQSNYGILAARPHTDAHDDRTEAITGPDDDLKPEILAQRLTKAAYREPILPKPQHTCRAGCGVLVSACGTMCAACTEQSNALRKVDAAADNRVIWAAVFGVVAGCPLYFAIFKLLGWMTP